MVSVGPVIEVSSEISIEVSPTVGVASSEVTGRRLVAKVVGSGRTLVGKTSVVEGTGSSVSVAEGSSVSVAEGSSVSVAEGSSVEVAEGSSVSVAEGSSLEVAEGSSVSVAEGSSVSVADGSSVEVAEGSSVEVTEGSLSVVEGLSVSEEVGSTVSETSSSVDVGEGKTKLVGEDVMRTVVVVTPVPMTEIVSISSEVIVTVVVPGKLLVTKLAVIPQQEHAER